MDMTGESTPSPPLRLERDKREDKDYGSYRYGPSPRPPVAMMRFSSTNYA